MAFRFLTIQDWQSQWEKENPDVLWIKKELPDFWRELDADQLDRELYRAGYLQQFERWQNDRRLLASREREQLHDTKRSEVRPPRR